MAKVDLSVINVIAELERVEWDFEFAGDEELRCCCPFHDDKLPSCHVNTQKRLFKCQTAGCEAKGDILSFLAKVLKTTRRTIFEDLSTRYTFDLSSSINPQTVERYHNALWKAKPMLRELYSRGLSDELIRKYRLGYDNGRIQIPIKNESGYIINVRKYLPGAPGPQKFRNTKGHGACRLFPIDQLSFDIIIICGGELKAIVAASLLNEHGIGCIAATAGEGNWEYKFGIGFKGKTVYVCFDIDAEGDKAADKVCARVKGDSRWIGKLRLPLDPDKYPHGDINDWVGLENATSEDFLNLLKTTDEWEQQSLSIMDDQGDIIDLHLAESVDAKYTSKRIRIKAVVSAMDTSPYVIPRRVRVSCDRNQGACSICPIFAITPDDKGFVYVNIPDESPAIIEMIATPKKAQREALIFGLGIPTCKVVEFVPTEFFNVEDVRLCPQLEISNRTADHIMQPALCIGHGLELNEGYLFTGRMYPHPKTQQSIILTSTYESTHDALSSYQPTDEELDELTILQPKTWTAQAIGDKLDEIYTDLAANVTRIYERQDLHLAVDLAYHSCLLFEFDGRITKGWVEVLVLGDSSQGKSETSISLMNHYNLGTKLECKNASVAGLLGGLQQMGNRWFVSWGIIPTHDKRLVILEELKGASTDVIGKLTDMRSSGVAEIPKIEKRRTHARTRLLALSNPRSDQPLASYSFGVEAVKELIGSLEDIRRFDTILMVSAEDIDPALLNELQERRPVVKHIYTSTICRRCVLWAWTRTTDQIKFTTEAVQCILKSATELCGSYTEIIPIVDRGSMRLKIARLAIAVACRTYSSTDGITVLIRKGHVQYIVDWLDRVYSSRVFGYKSFSDAIKSTERLLNPKEINVRISQMPFPLDFISSILYCNDIELRDLCDWCGWDRSDGLDLLSFLVRKHALIRKGRSYRKTPAFIELLKAARATIPDRPEHINEKF